jgi:hypothetical protein
MRHSDRRGQPSEDDSSSLAKLGTIMMPQPSTILVNAASLRSRTTTIMRLILTLSLGTDAKVSQVGHDDSDRCRHADPRGQPAYKSLARPRGGLKKNRLTARGLRGYNFTAWALRGELTSPSPPRRPVLPI